MKLIIGGTFQGKTAFACRQTGISLEQAADGMTCEYDAIYHVPMIYHFHEYVKRRMQDGLEYKNLPAEILKKNPQLVIVSNELGYGVVPIEAFDRRYREDTGRICCELAAASEEVWRVYCGIGTPIKGGKGE